ncbi:hypothetical protein ABVK25_009937 [Lepraria finkii]|uniref:Uncharacterized protein n=1 Tax=Lepraria finkii TaxID=1340010 RepID=A0ABR4AVY9_9LECA
MAKRAPSFDIDNIISKSRTTFPHVHVAKRRYYLFSRFPGLETIPFLKSPVLPHAPKFTPSSIENAHNSNHPFHLFTNIAQVYKIYDITTDDSICVLWPGIQLHVTKSLDKNSFDWYALAKYGPEEILAKPIVRIVANDVGQNWTRAREIVENIHMRVPRSVLMELMRTFGIEWEGVMAPKLGMIVVKRGYDGLNVSELDDSDLDENDLDDDELYDSDLDESDLEEL